MSAWSEQSLDSVDAINRFLQLQQALQDCIVEVREVLQANAAIAEENALLRDVVAMETEDVRSMCWHVLAEAASNQEHHITDTVWGTSFEDLAPTSSNRPHMEHVLTSFLGNLRTQNHIGE